MTKRSMFLVAALGLYASAVFVTPSHAASVYLTELVFVNTSGKAADDFEATFTGTGGTIANITVFNPPGTASKVVGGNSVRLDFTPAIKKNGVLDFQFDTNFGNIAFSSGQWTFKNGNPIASNAPIFINTALDSVPEPASMTLASVGGLGLLVMAIRRRFRSI